MSLPMFVQMASMFASMAARQRQAAQQRNAQIAQANRERERLLASYKAEERRRKAALKRELAARRARMSASGAGVGSDGSSSAILAGLVSQSEKEREEAAQRLGWGLDDLRPKSLLSSNSGNSLMDGLRVGLEAASLISKSSLFAEGKTSSPPPKSNRKNQ